MSLNLSENAFKVLERRYLMKDETGKIVETPEQLFRRVARAIADAERLYGKDIAQIKELENAFYEMMTSLEFMPNSPCLMNAGKELGQLSACFTLPIDDSMESIFETLKATSLIHKSGGGTGFSFSRLRPKNAVVRSTGGIASGPVSFMKVYDAATEAVKQGGSRRGANMGILRIDHPDILEFITCKDKHGSIPNFNISVAITDEFMRKVEKNEEYDLVDPHTKKVVKKINAREVFDLIVKQAHKNGEPGIIFIDRINEANPTPHLGEIESTNPCGEQPLLPYESCDLGSINLARMYKKLNNHFEIDWEKLKKITRLAVQFLDNLIDVNKYPLAQIEEATKKTRKIGLGVMGWASLLVRLGIPYDSEEAINLAEKVMGFILDEAVKRSCELAKEKGTFPAYQGSIWEKKGIKLRNATLTTIAPTGTISIIAGPCSSGIEPLFAIVYYREVMDKTKLYEVEPYFEELAKERGFYSQELMQRIAEVGSIKNFKEIPEEIRRVFVTAHDISPEWHVKMQAAFQKYVHNATSKCVTGDTVLFTEKGMMYISELYQNEPPDTFRKLNLKIADNNHIVESSDFYYGGEKKIIRLETDLGIDLAGTPNHRLKVFEEGENKWKFLSDFRINDFVPIYYGSRVFGDEYEFSKIYGRLFSAEKKTSSKTFGFPYKITCDLARLIGYIVADGSFNINSVLFSQQDKEIIRDYVDIFKRRFGLVPKLQPDKRRKELYNLVVNGRSLVEFFSEYIGIGKGALDKKVPKCIKVSGQNIIKNFIRGLTLDGYVDRRGRVCVLTSISKPLCKDVQMLLLNLGIVSKLEKKKIYYEYTKKENTKKAVYDLVVLPEFREEFIKQIGFAEKRKTELFKSLDLKREFDTTQILPFMNDLVRGLINKKWKSIQSLKLKRQLDYYRNQRKFANTSKDRLKWLLDICSDLKEEPEYKKIRNLVEKKVYFSKIKDITYGEEKVYDLYIPQTNSFIGNGLVNHNTINFPYEATVEDVKKAYLLAYQLGCKGITVYRDRSREEQVLNIIGNKEKKGENMTEEKKESPEKKILPRPRPEVITGTTTKVATGCGNLYVTINVDEEGKPFELFTQMGKAGGCAASQLEAIGRLVSLAFRSGIEVKAIVEQLRNIRCPSPSWEKGQRIFSCADAIARVIEKRLTNGIETKIETPKVAMKHSHEDEGITSNFHGEIVGVCPDCGGALHHEEGCQKCYACGYSKC